MAYETTGSNTKTSDDASTMGDAPGVVSAGGHAAAELGRSAARKAEQARQRAADGLESAARSVHSGADRMASVGHGAGDALASSARYVRDHELRNMFDDVMEVVRNNPGAALVAAAALGFLIGRAVMRN